MPPAALMNSGLSLSTDSTRPLTSHLDELTGRAGLLLFTLLTFALFWVWWVDEILAQYLQILSPCEVKDCMSVYAPAEWVAIRWLSVLLLSTISIIPIICWQMHSFASPGLLPREKRWLRWFIVLGGFLAISIVLTTSLLALPRLFLWAHNSGSANGVNAAYDAVELLRLSLSIAAVELVFILALLASIIAGLTGILNSNSVNWWRWRLHGITLLLIWALLPATFVGPRLILMLLSVFTLELSFTPFTSVIRGEKILPMNQGILDSDAALRRIAIIDCSCAGACSIKGQDVEFPCMAMHSFSGLCLSAEERDILIQEAMMQRWTDVIITGCDSTPLPEHFKSSMESLSIQLRGLSLLDIAASRPDGELATRDLELALAGMSDPWPAENIANRLDSIDRVGALHVGEKIPWGLVLGKDDHFVRVITPELLDSVRDVKIHS